MNPHSGTEIQTYTNEDPPHGLWGPTFYKK